MIKEKDQVFLKYELEKYSDFFYVFSEVLNGAIMRKHFVLFFVGNHKEKLKEWKRLGLIEIKKIGTASVILLRHCSALNKKRRSALTNVQILRSVLRMEYYLSLGLTTAVEIREYSDRGNNKVNRQGVSKERLGHYKATLHDKGVDIPSLDSKSGIDALDRLTFHGIFISQLRRRNGVLVPIAVYFTACDDNVNHIVKELLFAYRKLVALFTEYPNPVSVKPTITICTFSHKNLLPSVFGKLRQEFEFLTMTDEEINTTFNILKVENPFSYLDPSKLV